LLRNDSIDRVVVWGKVLGTDSSTRSTPPTAARRSKYGTQTSRRQSAIVTGCGCEVKRGGLSSSPWYIFIHQFSAFASIRLVGTQDSSVPLSQFCCQGAFVVVNAGFVANAGSVANAGWWLFGGGLCRRTKIPFWIGELGEIRLGHVMPHLLHPTNPNPSQLESFLSSFPTRSSSPKCK
jgi:hypothetical protein